MDYSGLLDVAMKLGYRLAMSGAETFRIEESINRFLSAYGISAEAFAIPNLLIINIETPDGQTMTRMRRIGHHGNDLDSVERYSNLSRRLCGETPSADDALSLLKATDSSRRKYPFLAQLAGNFLGAGGFAVFFGGNLTDSLCAGICGVLVGLINTFMDAKKVNFFFSTILSSFVMALAAYTMGASGLTAHTDAVVIGALMILVPGLLFTNAMRDIIFGDTNSGINRIVQVLLIAVAIALGTGAAWNLSTSVWGAALDVPSLAYPVWAQCIASLFGCLGFAVIFNIHWPGSLLCAFGGVISWAVYGFCFHFSGDEIFSYFIAAAVAGVYSEVMARIRKHPAISYLVVSIFPLLPGAGIYYTVNYIVRADIQNFTNQGIQTIAIAGALAVGILTVSTLARLWTTWKIHRYKT